MRSSPLHRAADRHVVPLTLVVMAAVGRARDAVDLEALEAALRRGDPGSAMAACDSAVQAFEHTLGGSKRQQKAAGSNTSAGVGKVIADTMAAGAGADDLCVIATDWTNITVDGDIPAHKVEDIKAALRALPPEFRSAVSSYSVRVSRELPILDDLGKETTHAGIARFGAKQVQIRLGGSVSDTRIGTGGPPIEVLRHELGHAFDRAVGERFGLAFLSDDPEFIEAFRADKQGAPTNSYLSYFATNPREAFAQAAAHALETGQSFESRRGKNRRAEFAQAFPNVWSWVTSTLSDTGALP